MDSTEGEETGVHFVELVQTLIKDTEQREHFFQVRNTFKCYMSILLILETKMVCLGDLHEVGNSHDEKGNKSIVDSFVHAKYKFVLRQI